MMIVALVVMVVGGLELALRQLMKTLT